MAHHPSLVPVSISRPEIGFVGDSLYPAIVLPDRIVAWADTGRAHSFQHGDGAVKLNVGAWRRAHLEQQGDGLAIETISEKALDAYNALRDLDDVQKLANTKGQRAKLSQIRDVTRLALRELLDVVNPEAAAEAWNDVG